VSENLVKKHNEYVAGFGKNLKSAALEAINLIDGSKNNNKNMLSFSDFLRSIEFKKIFVPEDEWNNLPQDDEVLNSKIISSDNAERIEKYKMILKKIWPFPAPEPGKFASELYFHDFYHDEKKSLVNFKTLDVMSYNSYHIDYHISKIKEELENIKKLPDNNLSEQEVNMAKNYFIDMFALETMKGELEKKIKKVDEAGEFDNWNSDQEAFEFLSYKAELVNKRLLCKIKYDSYFKDKFIFGRKSYEKSNYLELNVDEINYLSDSFVDILGESEDILYRTPFCRVYQKSDNYIKCAKISHALKRLAKQKTKEFVNKFKDFNPEKYNRAKCFDENESKYGSDFVDIDRLLKIKEIMSLNNKSAAKKLDELYKVGTRNMNHYFLEQENYDYEADKYFSMSFEKVETKFKSILSDKEYKEKLAWFFDLKKEAQKIFDDTKSRAIKKILIDDASDIYGFKLDDYHDNDYGYIWILGKDTFYDIASVSQIKKIIFDQKLNSKEKENRLEELKIDIKKSFTGYLGLYKKYFDVSKLTPDNIKKFNDLLEDTKECFKNPTKKEIIANRVLNIMKIVISLFTILFFDSKIFSKIRYAKENIKLEKYKNINDKLNKFF